MLIVECILWYDVRYNAMMLMYSHAWTSSLRWASSFNPQSTTCPDPALVNKPLVTFHSELRHHLNPLWDRSAEGKVTPTRIGVRRFDILVKVKEYVIWMASFVSPSHYPSLPTKHYTANRHDVYVASFSFSFYSIGRYFILNFEVIRLVLKNILKSRLIKRVRKWTSN